MKKELMDILACPACKGNLQLRPEQETDDDVITGALLCLPCGRTYPIVDSIPNFLPQEMLA